MKEDFLHYLWKFQKFTTSVLLGVNDERIQVIDVGFHNTNAGPDFLNAQVRIDDQLWAGNVEIHIKSEDWYSHHHEQDLAYNSVILHVVWEHTVDVFRSDNSIIPSLEIASYLDAKSLDRYTALFGKNCYWIPCEGQLKGIPKFTTQNWLERLYFERLERKSEVLIKQLVKSENHWEQLLFISLARSFGLAINADPFQQMAQSIPFRIVKKCMQDVQLLEALFFGTSGLLEGPTTDSYHKKLKEEYAFLRKKFKLKPNDRAKPKYFRLRPANFPTIRLAQLAMLYASTTGLFSKAMDCKDLNCFYDLFNVHTSAYWETHYNFGTSSSKRAKNLSHKSIDRLLINSILPIQFCYAKSHGRDVSEAFIMLASSICAESNTIVKGFINLNVVAKNAIESQGLLELKTNYCDNRKCVQCAIGNEILGKQ